MWCEDKKKVPRKFAPKAVHGAEIRQQDGGIEKGEGADAKESRDARKVRLIRVRLALILCIVLPGGAQLEAFLVVASLLVGDGLLRCTGACACSCATMTVGKVWRSRGVHPTAAVGTVFPFFGAGLSA